MQNYSRFVGLRPWVWALVCGLAACQSEPEPLGLQRDNSKGAGRDQFFRDKSNTETLSAEQIANDQKVKELSTQVKADPFLGCGYSSHQAADSLTLDPIQLRNPGSRIVSGRVTIISSGGVSIAGSLSSLSFQNSFSVVSATPNNATNAAMREAQKSSLTTQFQAIPQAEVQSSLGGSESKALCGMIMVRGQKAMSADNTTFINASYDKPVIQMISPKLSVERIKLELQNPIKIRDVIATLETNDEAISDQGLVKRGEVEVSLIPPERNLSDSLGNNVSIKSEVAYRVTSKFVDAAGNNPEQSSVLDQIAEFYISGQKVTHMIVKTPRPEMPLIIYSQP